MTRTLPDGLAEVHLKGDRGVQKHASLLSIAILGAIVLVASSGYLGGGGDSALSASGDDGTLEFLGPTRLRNGMFFEAHVVFAAKRPIKKLELSLAPGLVRDLTMNSMIPAADSETFRHGEIRYSFGRVAARDSFDVKFDFQINPSLFAGTSGTITASDDGRQLARLPVRITVAP